MALDGRTITSLLIVVLGPQYNTAILGRIIDGWKHSRYEITYWNEATSCCIRSSRQAKENLGGSMHLQGCQHSQECTDKEDCCRIEPKQNRKSLSLGHLLPKHQEIDIGELQLNTPCCYKWQMCSHLMSCCMNLMQSHTSYHILCQNPIELFYRLDK